MAPLISTPIGPPLGLFHLIAKCGCMIFHYKFKDGAIHHIEDLVDHDTAIKEDLKKIGSRLSL